MLTYNINCILIINTEASHMYGLYYSKIIVFLDYYFYIPAMPTFLLLEASALEITFAMDFVSHTLLGSKPSHNRA
jgi:hypothetical protein